MEFIRSENRKPSHDPNTRHCLYGLDADLVGSVCLWAYVMMSLLLKPSLDDYTLLPSVLKMMLGLTSHEPNFSLLREEVRFGGKKNQKRWISLMFKSFLFSSSPFVNPALFLYFKDNCSGGNNFSPTSLVSHEGVHWLRVLWAQGETQTLPHTHTHTHTYMHGKPRWLMETKHVLSMPGKFGQKMLCLNVTWICLCVFFFCFLFFFSQKHIGSDYDLERIIDDWILMGFLVGNDFIPHLPHLHISHDALPLLYKTYISVLPSLGGETRTQMNQLRVAHKISSICKKFLDAIFQVTCFLLSVVCVGRACLYMSAILV